MKSTALLAIALSTALPATANQALATQHGCLGCHAAASKGVGPSYREVATRYAGDSAAPAALAKSIRAGGAGKWGDMAMPPQPKLPEADAKRLAAWILGGAR